MLKYESLSGELCQLIEHENKTSTYKNMGFENDNVIRRRPENDKANVWRKPFVRDIDKVMHCPYFSRYADKTQVFSFYKNDDITRRNLHVQLVSRIARTIGSVLHLNLDLIEAIALGHDLGHPAFAHTGERHLDKLYNEHTGKHFLHNLQSVRVLDKIFPYNISLQTLHDIAAHNGELELEEYTPVPISSFEEFDELMEKCTCDISFSNHMMPCTLEGAVVRISDIIAYLGKDRQDAVRAKLLDEDDFYDDEIGSINAEIINNLVVNIIENSYGKPYIKLDDAHFSALKKAKKENYEKIYNKSGAHTGLGAVIQPMMEEVYGQLLDDLKNGVKTSPIFTHHIAHINALVPASRRQTPYEQEEPNQLVIDYIASMTDDYFIELHGRLFKESPYQVRYHGYFEE